MLFSDRSIWTMVHGIVFGGGALMALGAVLFAMIALMHPVEGSDVGGDTRSGAVAALTVVVAAVFWVTVFTGTFDRMSLSRSAGDWPAPRRGTDGVHAQPRRSPCRSPGAHGIAGAERGAGAAHTR